MGFIIAVISLLGFKGTALTSLFVPLMILGLPPLLKPSNPSVKLIILIQPTIKKRVIISENIPRLI